MKMVRRVGALLLVTAMLVPALTSCSGDDDGNTDAKVPGSSAGAAPASSAGSAGGAVASASPGAAVPALPVLVSRDGADKEIPIRVELNDLRVEGKVTRLTFTARNLSPVVPGRSDRWQIADFFNDGINQKPAGGSLSDDVFSVDGVYLLDSAGGKRYLAARNAAKGCVCSADLSNTLVSAGNGVVLTTLFAALPAEVTAVDVVVPGFGPFNAVPVSR